MKYFLITCYLPFACISALEYEVQFENNEVCVSKVVMAPKEEIGLHRDASPQIVIGLKGGIVTRLEMDGREVPVEFLSGKAVYRPADPEGEMHKAVNRSEAPIEILVIQLKK